MNKSISVLLFISFLLSLTACAILGSTTHGIKWFDEDLSDYVLYIYAPYKDTLTVVDLKSGEPLQKFTAFKGIQSVVSNQDGSRIYVSTGSGTSGGNPGEIYEVNTKTWEHRKIHNYAAHLLSDYEGGLYFLNKQGSYRVFGAIDPDRGEVTMIDALDIYRGSWFDASLIGIDSKTGFLYAMNESNDFFQYHFESKTRNKLFGDLVLDSTAQFILSPDGSQVYFAGGYVLDVSLQKVVGNLPTPHLGSLAVRQDNKEVYATDPGGYFHDPEPSGRVAVYSPIKDRIIDEIAVRKDGYPLKTDQIYLTHNERYAVVSDWIHHIFIIDLKERRVIKTHSFSDSDEFPLLVQGFCLSAKPGGFNQGRP